MVHVAIRDSLRAGHMQGYQKIGISSLADSEMFKAPQGSDPNIPRPRGVHGTRNNEMTDQQRSQLMLVRQRDALIDEELGKLGEGLDELKQIALAQNEEAKLQNSMLTTLEEKVDLVHDKVLNVNQRLKNTIEQVRSTDKICLDIFCVLLLIGMIVVVVKVTTYA